MRRIKGRKGDEPAHVAADALPLKAVAALAAAHLEGAAGSALQINVEVGHDETVGRAPKKVCSVWLLSTTILAR